MEQPQHPDELLKNIAEGGERADLEMRRREHFMNVIASSSNLNVLYQELVTLRDSDATVGVEDKEFFKIVAEQVGGIIDQLSGIPERSALALPVVPRTPSDMKDYVESGKLDIPTTYGIRTKVEELLGKLVEQK
jgi:hypothetical protein